MCGILGMHTANKSGYFSTDVDAFKAMLLMTSLRGRHSTGVFGVSKFAHDKDKVSLVKVVGNPFNLDDWDVSEEYYKRFVQNFGTAVGHCRYATRGEISASNAHPFKEGHITLVHNGMISNYEALRDPKKHADISVDSHLIAKLIADEGAEAILPRVHGAYVFIWWDSNDGTLNMARNAARPLFIAQTDKDGILFASEGSTVAWNAMRHNQKYSSVAELPTFQIRTYKQGSIEPEIKEYKEKYISYPETKVHTPATVTQISKKESKKFRATAATPESKKLLQNITNKEERVIEVGDRMEFSLGSIDRTPSCLRLYLEHPDFPHAEFLAIIDDAVQEKDLQEAAAIRGTISTIFPVKADETASGVPWKVWLTQCNLIKVTEDGSFDMTKISISKLYSLEELDDDLFPTTDIIISGDDDDAFATADIQLVLVEDSDGTTTQISNATYLKHIEAGCAWCTDPFKPHEASSPRSLLLWRTHGRGKNVKYFEGLICPGCKEQFLSGTVQ